MVMGLAAAAPAHAAGNISADVQAQLSADGILTVIQTFTPPEDALPAGTMLDEEIPLRLDLEGKRYTFDVSDPNAVSNGSPVDVTVRTASGVMTISLNVTAVTEVKYTVRNVTRTAADGNLVLAWPLLQGVNVDLSSVTGTVIVPPGAINYNCLSGVPDAMVSCTTYLAGTHGRPAMDFTQNNLPASRTIQAQITFAPGSVPVTEKVSGLWTLTRALTVGGTQVGFMIGVILVGGLGLYGIWRRMRRFTGEPFPVARFVPGPGGTVTFEADRQARPGMIGTLVDSSVDPADILATILDLAVRGHLLITEVETSRHAVADWTFTRLEGPGDLREYERVLLEALTSESASVSTMPEMVRPVVPAVQQALYAEVLSAGWFSRLPSKKSPMVVWAWTGIAASVAVAAALLAFTTFAIVGPALVGVAIVALVLAWQTPPVSAAGTAVFAGLQELAGQLRAQADAVKDAEMGYEQISDILPYAVVLGGWDRWLSAMVAADHDEAEDSADLAWYHAPAGWHMRDLPASLDAFITVVTGRLFTRA